MKISKYQLYLSCFLLLNWFKKRCKQVNELFVFQEEVNRRGNLIRESNDKQRLIGFGCDAVSRLTFIKDPVIHDPAGLSLIPVYSNFG